MNINKSEIKENCMCGFCGRISSITNTAGSFTANYCYDCLKMLRDEAIQSMKEIREYKKVNNTSASRNTSSLADLKEDARQALEELMGTDDDNLIDSMLDDEC